MTDINQIISLLVENGIPVPPQEGIANITEIDNSVEGTRSELQHALETLEHAHRGEWQLGQESSWNGFEGTQWASFPGHNNFQFVDVNALWDIHRSRHQTVKEIFSGWHSITIEDGGLKSFKRAKEKLDLRRRMGRDDHCPDLTRVRLVAADLSQLERAYYHLVRSMPLEHVGNFNHYGTDIGKKYPTPFRGVNTNWCSSHMLGGNVATEVQLLTKRVRVLVDIDHPFNVSKTVQYPDQALQDYVYGLMLKASILDFQEMFSE